MSGGEREHGNERLAVASPDDLVSWVEEVGGGRLVSARRQQGARARRPGSSTSNNPTGAVAARFLRYDRSDPSQTLDPWTLHREATVYLALQDTPVPVPRVLGVHPVHQAMLSEHAEGENWFCGITDPAEQEATAHHFMATLAALHALDPRTLDLPAFPPVRTVAEAVHAELDEWERLLAGRGVTPDPALAFSLHWLRRHVPAYDGPPVLVQGDTGPGNFMYQDGRVVVVVDWELAHLGDPMDDIAWLSLRATQEPFGDFPTRMREYEEFSGTAVDAARVAYYRVMAETKLQVMSSRPDPGGADGPGAGGEDQPATAGGDVGNGFIYQMLHRRLWLEALADATGLELTAPEEPRARHGATTTGSTPPSSASCAAPSCRGSTTPWPRPAPRAWPGWSSTWPRWTPTAPSTRRASSRTSARCSAPPWCRSPRAVPRPPRRWRPGR